MMTDALLHPPEEPQSAVPVTKQRRNCQEKGAPLLELRSEAGAVYVCPSRWQRIRLQWAFRHFHILPPQVLSRRDQRLVEKLSRSAVVTPAFPVAGKTVFGVVEKVRPTSPAATPRVALRPKPAEIPPFLVKAEKPKPPTEATGNPKARQAGVQWGALGALAAAGLTVILASVYLIPLLSLGKDPRALSTPMAHAANGIKPLALDPAATHPVPASLITVSSPTAEIPRHRLIPAVFEPMPPEQEPAPLAGGSDPPVSAGIGGTGSRSLIPAIATVTDTSSEPVPIAASAAPERLFVSEMPQGHFAYPAHGSDRVGELQLKAVIGADGLVKDVTVLSGDPQLAEAAMRAVRQWHYRPYEVQGKPVEVETQIKMSFFGQDAVSIASVANGSTPQIK